MIYYDNIKGYVPFTDHKLFLKITRKDFLHYLAMTTFRSNSTTTSAIFHLATHRGNPIYLCVLLHICFYIICVYLLIWTSPKSTSASTPASPSAKMPFDAYLWCNVVGRGGSSGWWTVDELMLQLLMLLLLLLILGTMRDDHFLRLLMSPMFRTLSEWQDKIFALSPTMIVITRWY